MSLPKFMSACADGDSGYSCSKTKHSHNSPVNVGKHLLKTKVCSLFLNGRCHYGSDRCYYAHSVDELREQPQLERTSLCPAFKKGKCHGGDNCRYAHSVEEMTHSAKRVMCLWHQNGHCSHGVSCRFAHGEGELRKHRDLSRNHTLSGDDSTVSRRDSTVSSLFSPSTTPTVSSPAVAATSLSFDELDSPPYRHSSGSVSILDLFTTSAIRANCANCGSATECMCRVFEECSELLRLL